MKQLIKILTSSTIVSLFLWTQCVLHAQNNGNRLFENLIESNGKFHKNIVTNNLYLVFDKKSETNYNKWGSITNNDLLGVIINPTYSEFNKLKTLNPANIWSIKGIDSVSMYKIDKSTLIIPMNEEGESTIFTNWKILENDTIQFVNCITPNIWTKYATASVINHHVLNGKLYLFCKGEGGEGGSNFESFWIAEYNGINNYKVISDTTIGYCHDSGDWAKLDYKLKGQAVELYETRDSLTIIDNNWKLFKSSTKLIETIELK